MAEPNSSFPDAAALDAQIGSQYEVLEMLAHGGMGAVYKARHAQLERLVAIKILAPHLGENTNSGTGFQFQDRFEVEARAMASLKHTHIVSVYDYGITSQGIRYIVMEYVEGENLQTIMDKGELRQDHALTLARQITEALIYSHEEGMVHRDIKPANILIDRRGLAKVTDFGLVKVMGSHRFNTLAGFGTPGYYAPEIEDSGKADERSDIYSFGVLLYKMLTGHLPAGLWEPVSMVKPDLDDRFDPIISRALRRKPEDRYQTLREMKADLDSIAFHNPDGLSRNSNLACGALCKRLAIVFVSLFVVSTISSLYDIYFNQNYIGWLLEQPPEGRVGQQAAFQGIIGKWNCFAYLVFPAIWAWKLFGIRKLDPDAIETRRRLVNLPWWGAGIGAAGWLLSIPAIFFLMSDFAIPSTIKWLLPVSILIKAGISVPLGFLVTEMLLQRLIYPYFFTRNDLLSRVEGTYPLNLRNKGIFWIISSCVCPILALLLLVVSLHAFDAESFARYHAATDAGFRLFAPVVALVAVVFTCLGAVLLQYLVVLPIAQLREATRQINEGNFNVRLDPYHSDEFGELAFEFNRMAAGLREREHLRILLDRHYAENLARELMHTEGPHSKTREPK